MSIALLLLALATSTPAPADPARDTSVRAATRHAANAKVTVLSTMLAGDPGAGIGEWGYAALIEVDGRTLLLDTGARPETVLRNAAELGIDLSSVPELVLTHNHDDHTGGLLALRRELSKRNPEALRRVHVASGMFWQREGVAGSKAKNAMLDLRTQYEAMGGTFVEHAGAVELMPGVWFTGPVPRKHPERNWSGSGRVRAPAGVVEDNVPEDASIVIDTPQGLIVVSGCGHAGIVNTVEYAQTAVRNAPVITAIGGFHLFNATDDQLAWTASRLKAAGLTYLLGGHCTGIEAVFRIRELAGLTRRTAVVSSVGSTYTHGTGIASRLLAR